MAINRAGAGVPHDYPDFFSHRRLITMDRAFGAGSLTFLERTFIKTLYGIILEFRAIRADSVYMVF